MVFTSLAGIIVHIYTALIRAGNVESVNSSRIDPLNGVAVGIGTEV